MSDQSEPVISRFPVVGVALAVVFSLAAVFAFGFAFIGDGGDNGDGGEEPVDGPGKRGGTLRVGVVGLGSLDPADARDPTAVMVADQLFDTLVTYDPTTLAPEPGLASTFEVNPEQTVFTFRLAEGATFHDGTPVTSADVKFTLERIGRKGSTSPLVAQLDSVAGYGPFHVDGSAPDLAGVATPDAATVVVTLDRAFSTFPSVLGHPGFGIVPKAAVETLGEGFKQAPVGSGPFMFAFRATAAGTPATAPAAEDPVTLTRFAGHLSAPLLDAIDLVAFDDAPAAYAAFKEGNIDVAPVPPAMVTEAAERFGSEGTRPYIGIVFYGMNLKSPDLADVRFRQAVTLAVNRQKIVDGVYRSSVDPATGLVAAGVPGRAEDACGDRCDYDPERAKVLLGEAFGGGPIPEVTVDHDDDPTQAAVAAAIQGDLAAVGIPSVLRPHPLSEYGTFLVSGAAELFRLGWIADYPSPDGFLQPLFASSSPENLVGLASPEVDAKLAAARAEADPGARDALYREAEQLVLDQFVVVPVVQLETRLVVGERVRSLAVDLIGSFDGAAVSLAGK